MSDPDEHEPCRWCDRKSCHSYGDPLFCSSSAAVGSDPDPTASTNPCQDWGDDLHEPQETCPVCEHYALHHSMWGCVSCEVAS